MDPNRWMQDMWRDDRHAQLVKPEWHGVNPGSLLRPDLGIGWIKLVISVRKPSERTRRIAARGLGRAPDPCYVTLNITHDGAVLRTDATWRDIEGELVC